MGEVFFRLTRPLMGDPFPKIPQFVRFVEGFPISAAGKVLKEELKKRAVEELNL